MRRACYRPRSTRCSVGAWTRARGGEVPAPESDRTLRRAATLAEVEARGPIAASELTDRGRRGKHAGGWSWSDGKRVMAGLLISGQIAVSRRGIEQLYDLTERVIPRAVLDAPVPEPEDAKRELIVLAARAMGVATAKDLADYFHIGGYLDRGADPDTSRAPALIADLVDDGRLLPVTVEGCSRDPTFMVPGAPRRRRSPAACAALAVRLDDLGRAARARLFGFDYRIEIYIPEAKRVHGYHVLPFLLGDTLVARVDLKADRKNRALVVQEHVREPGADKQHVAHELGAELGTMAGWLVDLAASRCAGAATSPRPCDRCPGRVGGPNLWR